ncbi:R8 protein, partial [Tilletia horrida]
MFYNLELLNKPKSRLGIVWLAATIGNRSSFKKLSKSDIGSVDLVKICQQLAAPDEAMALRLSSQLLYGTVKIYDQQLDSLQKAAEAMQLALKRSFLQSTMQTSKTEVLGLKVAAPKDITLGKIKSAGAITLKPNEYWCELGRVLGKDPMEIYHESGFGSSASASDSQRAASAQLGRQRSATPAHGNSSQPTTRKAWQLPGAQYGTAAHSASLGDTPSDQNFGLGALNFDAADIDLGLFDTIDYNTIPGADDTANRQTHGKFDFLADPQFDVGDQNVGHVAGPSDAAEMLMGKEPRARAGSKTGSDLASEVGRNVSRPPSGLDLLDHHADDMFIDRILSGLEAANFDMQVDHMPGTPARLQADAIDGLTTTNGAGEKRKITQLEDHLNDVSLDDELPPPPPPKRPRVKLPKLRVDERIQLTQDEMRASRQDYVQRQTELRERQDATKRKKEIDNWVAGMTSFKLFDTGNAEPWAVVVQVFEDKDQELAAFKASAQAEYRKTGRTVFAEDESESLGPLAMAALLHEMRQRSSSRAGSVQPAGILSEKARGKQRAISPRSAREAPMRMAQAGQHEAGSSASNAPATAPRRGSLSLSDILRGGNVQHQMTFGAGLGDGDNFMFDGGFEQGLGLRSRQGSFADAMPLYDAGGRAGPPPSDSLLCWGTSAAARPFDTTSFVGALVAADGSVARKHYHALKVGADSKMPTDGAEGIQSQDLGIKL